MLDCVFLHVASLDVMFCRFERDKDIDIIIENDKESRTSNEAVVNLSTVGFEGIANIVDEDCDDGY